MRIYFDNAATTPLHPEVIETITSLMKTQYGNPSSIHAEGRKMRSIVEEARKTVAHCLKAGMSEIFFTSGGTESNNMAIKCAVRDLGVRRIISSPIEHHNVLHPLKVVENQGVEVKMLHLDSRGRIDFSQLESLLAVDSTGKTLVSLMHGNNEIGTLTNMQQVSSLCETYGAFFHSDTVQTMGKFPIDVSKTKVHFLAGGAHKFHGPKGTGFIYINGEVRIKPFIDGGSQERNMRGGTENVYGIAGMASALKLSCNEMEKNRTYIEGLRTYFMEQLQEHFDDIQFNGDYDGECLYTVLSVSFPHSAKSDLLLLQLDMAGISASGGSACSSGAETASHVLTSIGASPERKTIRFSFSHFNTREEVDQVIAKLKVLLEKNKTIPAS